MTNGSIEIELNETSAEVEDIKRCLSVLYSSRAGTLALDRNFGIDWSFLDMPTVTAQALLEGEIIQKTRKYESRCEVKKVLWSGDNNIGQMIPKVVLEIV